MPGAEAASTRGHEGVGPLLSKFQLCPHSWPLKSHKQGFVKLVHCVFPSPHLAPSQPLSGCTAVPTCRSLPRGLLEPKHLTAEGSVQKFKEALSKAHLVSGVVMGAEDMKTDETGPLLLRAWVGEVNRFQG